MDPTAGRDWIDYLTLGFSAAALITSISAVVYTHKGFRIGSKRALKLEIATAIATDDPLRITVHNLGGRPETLSRFLLVDGVRKFETTVGNIVVPAYDNCSYELNRGLVASEWRQPYPELGPKAVVEVWSVAGTVARLENPKPELLLDGMAAARVEALRELGTGKK